MSMPNIEVVPDVGGWRWRIIGDCGRALVHGAVYACDLAAFNAGKAWRAAFLATAANRDAAS